MGAKEFVEKLLERAPVVSFVKDSAGKYLYVNNTWLTLFHVTREQVLGHSDLQIFPKHLATSYVDNDRRVLASGQSLEFDELFSVNGQEHSYLSIKFPLIHGGQLALGGISIDVTAREAARRTLAQSEARFRRLVEHSPEAFVVVDLNSGLFVDTNESACALFGRSREEILRSSPSDLSPPLQANGRNSRDMVSELFEAALRGEFPVFDWVHQHADGSLIPCRIWLSHIDDCGQPWVRASILDTREIDRNRQALVDAQLQLDRARRLESLGRLAGGVAHDFNNLLTIMVGSITFLDEMLEPSTAVTEELNTLRDAALQARGLTRQLLIFAREPAGRDQVVDVDHAIDQTLGTLRRLVGEDVSLSSSLNAPAAKVWIEPGQLDQIMLNLVANAREAVGSGGHIFVETLQLAAPSAGEPEKVVLIVRDDGHGMSPEIKEQAFDPFFSTKTGGRGAGLGLSTVYGIVKAAGGEASIDSRSGKGTTVRVVFPCYEGKVEMPPAQTNLPPADQACILVVEDESAVRRVTTRILTRKGYRVLEAELPEAAIRIAEQEKDNIDMIVSDVVMPQMNGFQLVDQLELILGPLPVLFVSGYPSEALQKQTIRTKDINLLPKPFTVEELTERIQALLSSEAVAID